MKNILIILFLQLSFAAFAQNWYYHPVPNSEGEQQTETGKHFWYEINIYNSGFEEGRHKIDIYENNTDNISVINIDSKQYGKYSSQSKILTKENGKEVYCLGMANATDTLFRHFIQKEYINKPINTSELVNIKGTFKDKRDSKEYNIVTMESQTWFAENLAFEVDTGCYKYPDNNEYGLLYDWHRAQNVCPVGWHLSNNEDWELLIKNCGGMQNAGKKLKSTDGWLENTGTNESGFNALSGGSYFDYPSGSIQKIRKIGGWWSATIYSDGLGYMYAVYYKGDIVLKDKSEKGRGYNVRCIKD